MSSDGLILGPVLGGIRFARMTATYDSHILRPSTRNTPYVTLGTGWQQVPETEARLRTEKAGEVGTEQVGSGHCLPEVGG